MDFFISENRMCGVFNCVPLFFLLLLPVANPHEKIEFGSYFLHVPALSNVNDNTRNYDRKLGIC